MNQAWDDHPHRSFGMPKEQIPDRLPLSHYREFSRLGETAIFTGCDNMSQMVKFRQADAQSGTADYAPVGGAIMAETAFTTYYDFR